MFPSFRSVVIDLFQTLGILGLFQLSIDPEDDSGGGMDPNGHR